jgi:hypothetical protein
MVSLLNGGIALHGSPEALLNGMGKMAPSEAAQVKSALSSSINGVFVFGAAISAVALALSFLLKELPLRKTHAPPVGEAGDRKSVV